MPDSGFIFSPAFRVVTDAIAAVNGGSLEFYNAGTSTPKTVYSDSTLSTSLGSTVYLDSGGHPVSAQGGSTKVMIYTGSALVKIIVKTSAGVTLATYDNVKCTEDTSAFTGGSGSSITGVVSKTANYTITTDDDGLWIDCDPTGGEFTITLLSAVTAGDGFAVGLRHSGTTTTNAVKIATSSAQTIGIDGTTATGYALTGGSETLWLVSNGANWRAITHVPPRLSWNGIIRVADRLSAPPTSPNAGAYYIVTTSPTGVWSSYALHDIVRADGQGNWIKLTPQTDCGWLAYVEDENTYYGFIGTAWTALSNVTAPTESVLPYGVWQDRKSDGTVGGQVTTAAWTTATLNQEVYNTITGASLASNKVTLPAGTYLASVSHSQQDSSLGGLRMRLETAGTIYRTPNYNVDSADNSVAMNATYVVVVPTGGDNLIVEYYATSNTGTGDLGPALTISSGTEYEVYRVLTVISLTAQQGPQGAQGTQGNPGNDGGIGAWNWEISTSSGPSTGAVRFNNGTFSSVTAIYLSETDANSRALSALIATWDDSTSTIKGYIRCHENAIPTNFWYGTISALTDNGSDVTLTVSHLSSSGSFSAGDDVIVELIPKGDKGDTGAAGTTVPDISGLTEDTTPDASNDYLITYDVSASSHKKVKPSNLAVIGPASSTDNALTRYNGTTGRSVQDSGVTLGDDAKMLWPAANAATKIISADQTVTGSVGAAFAFVDLNFTTTMDGVDNIGLLATLRPNGAAADGSHTGVLGQVIVQDATSASNVAPYHHGVCGFFIAGSDENGTSTSVGARGDGFGMWAHAHLINGATNWNVCTGMEISARVDTGASTRRRTGLYIQSLGNVNGADYDYAIGIAASADVSFGALWKNGIIFDDSVSSLFPIAAGGTLFRAGMATSSYSVALASGIDLEYLTGTYTKDAIVLCPNNGGVRWGSTAAGGSILSATTSNGGYLSFASNSTKFGFSGSDKWSLDNSGNTSQSGGAEIRSTSANALAVGRQGTTDPVLKIDASAATVATGIAITGAAAASRAAVAVISSGTNEGLSLDAKGSGTIRLGATSTGAVEFSRNAVPTASDGAALGTTALMWSDLFLASGGVINFNNGDVTFTHSANTMAFAGASSGYTFDAAPLPSANDGAALGASGTAWSDLFLASGSVINFAAGDVTITHATNMLTFAGASSGCFFEGNLTVSNGSVYSRNQANDAGLYLDGEGGSFARVYGVNYANSGFVALVLQPYGNYVGFGTTSPTQVADISDDSIRVRTSKTPASAAASGTQGQIAWDSSYVYVCTATNTWKRAAIATW